MYILVSPGLRIAAAVHYEVRSLTGAVMNLVFLQQRKLKGLQCLLSPCAAGADELWHIEPFADGCCSGRLDVDGVSKDGDYQEQ